MKSEWTLKEISNWTKDNSNVEIPVIQRGLVWKPQQVELLWDSILRQFPIGAFMLSFKSNKENERFELIDGQQRWNAIASGYNAYSEDSILWFDLKPESVWNGNTTRRFFIRATTKAHPWGYKANDECNTLNTQDKRAALEEFGVKYDDYECEISLSETYPKESGLPVPLSWMIAAGEEDCKDKFVKFIKDKVEENMATHKFKLKKVDEINDSLIAKYYESFKDLPSYKVPTIYINQETIDKESGNKDEDGAQSGIEILFERIGRGGTRIPDSELMYSAVKAYWPELKDENDRLAKLYMPPQTLISLAFQLVLSTKNKGFERVPSVPKIRKLAGDNDIRSETDKNGSLMSRILSSVDQWLTNHGKIPKVLRTTIARKSPEVYLLLMVFAMWNEEGLIVPTPKEESLFRATAYYLHWLVSDKFGVANCIYKAVAGHELSQWENIIKKELMMAEFKLAAPPIKPPTSKGLSYEYGLAAPDSTQLRACAELQDISIWTEKKVYPLDVSSVDVYVWNPTSMPFSFGRRWNLEIWKKGKWVAVKCKASVILCKDDKMSGETTPELLCFHFPVSQWYHLEKGKYRICKSFSHDGKKLALNAEFEIK